MSNYPKSWLLLPLGEVIQTQKGKKPVNLGLQSDTRTIPYINIAAFETKVIAEYAPEQDIPQCQSADTLLVWDGARAGLSGRGISGYIGSTLSRITSDLCDPSYLFYFINSNYGTLNSQTKGVGIPHVNPVVLNTLQFPLAPMPEQKRIVDKLEELLSDLDAGVDELKSAQAKLVQYRQSLLKSAVEGTLTAEWRIKNTPKETGEELFQRILKERRKIWEEKQLEKYKEQGKQPPKGWKDKYPEPVQPDTKYLPTLPKGWVWTSLDALISNGPQNGLYLPKSNYGNGLPILRIDDFQIGWHRERSKLKRVQMERNLLNIYSLNIGELVINRVNSMTHLGKSLEVTKKLEGIVFESNMMRIQLSALVSPSLVATYLGSNFGRKLLINNAKWAVNQASINQQDVKNTPIPLMSIEEQTEININIKQQFEALDNQLLAVEKGFNQLAVQRKNILKSAFAGQLVSQSVDDEPASVLIERIKKERLKNSSDNNKKVKGIKPMKKNIHESLREWIISRGDKPFSFEEISKSSEYEQIKDAIYDLLSEKEPLIEQVFNEDLQQMLFKKVKQ